MTITISYTKNLTDPGGSVTGMSTQRRRKGVQGRAGRG